MEPVLLVRVLEEQVRECIRVVKLDSCADINQKLTLDQLDATLREAGPSPISEAVPVKRTILPVSRQTTMWKDQRFGECEHYGLTSKFHLEQVSNYLRTSGGWIL